MSSASSSIETPVLIVLTFDCESTSLLKGMSRDALRISFGAAMVGSPGRLAKKPSLSPSFRHRSPALLSLSLRGIACISEATRSGRRGWRLRFLSLKDVIRRLRGRARGARDRAIVFSNDLEPGSDIVGVTNSRGDARGGANEGAAHFRDESLARINWRAEHARLVAIEARGMAGAMR